MNKSFKPHMRLILFLFLSLTIIGTINQSVQGQTSPWDYQDTISNGKLSIEMDPRLKKHILDMEAKICERPVEIAPPTEMTPEEKCVRQNMIMGYKIQIFYTKDRKSAEKVRNDFARQHPDLSPEMVYASPDYRVLVGDYFTRNSARSDLRRIQKAYPSAFTVQWRIWCRKAK